jgi:hypothetical protein
MAEREHPISRVYYRLLVEDGRHLTLFRDLTTNERYEPKYD